MKVCGTVVFVLLFFTTVLCEKNETNPQDDPPAKILKETTELEPIKTETTLEDATRKKKSATTTTFCVEIRPSNPYQRPFQVCEPEEPKPYPPAVHSTSQTYHSTEKPTEYSSPTKPYSSSASASSATSYTKPAYSGAHSPVSYSTVSYRADDGLDMVMNTEESEDEGDDDQEMEHMMRTVLKKKKGHSGLLITCQPSLAGYASSVPYYGGYGGYGGYGYRMSTPRSYGKPPNYKPPSYGAYEPHYAPHYAPNYGPPQYKPPIYKAPAYKPAPVYSPAPAYNPPSYKPPTYPAPAKPSYPAPPQYPPKPYTPSYTAPAKPYSPPSAYWSPSSYSPPAYAPPPPAKPYAPAPSSYAPPPAHASYPAPAAYPPAKPYYPPPTYAAAPTHPPAWNHPDSHGIVPNYPASYRESDNEHDHNEHKQETPNSSLTVQEKEAHTMETMKETTHERNEQLHKTETEQNIVKGPWSLNGEMKEIDDDTERKDNGNNEMTAITNTL